MDNVECNEYYDSIIIKHFPNNRRGPGLQVNTNMASESSIHLFDGILELLSTGVQVSL